MILNSGYDEEWIQTITTGKNLDEHLLNAIEAQQKLGEHSLAKEYLSVKCEPIQKQWEMQFSQKGAMLWKKEVICAIHTFTYGTWKLRNEFEHGKSEFSSRAQKRQRLQQDIKNCTDNPDTS